MKQRPASLAELHRRFDGPIEEGMRQAALAGQRRTATWALSTASRDLDRLALSTVSARARQRWAASKRIADRLDDGSAETALKDALSWYRALGVQTNDARKALDRVLSTQER
jgi:hypothetical protein